MPGTIGVISPPLPLRVLHLEDDWADAEHVAGELMRGGLNFTTLRVNSEAEFVRAVQDFAPDVVLSDHARQTFNARSALEHLRTARPTTPLIVVTGALSEQLVVEYIRAGAADYVSKANLARLQPAIEKSVESRRRLERLTPRQREVLRLVADGLSTAEVAQRLGLSIKTVETHRTALMDRLGMHHLAGLIRFAMQVGLVLPAV